MKRIFYMMRKEFQQIFRDPPMIAIIFVVPVVQLLVLAFAITTDVTHVKLLVADLDNSTVSREIVRGFSTTDRFDIVGQSSNLMEIEKDMRGWKVQIALVIPENFSRDLQRNLHPQIEVVMDGVDGNTAGVAVGYAQGILSDFGLNYMSNPVRLRTIKRPHLAVMQERMWYNPNLISRDYMVPGIVVVLLTILPMMLSAMSLVKEKEIGTLEQLLVTPLRKSQLLMGKIIPFLILSYVELTIVTLVAVFVFKIDMNGSYTLLALLALIFLFTTIGLGIFTSTITQSQQQAMFVAWFIMVFMLIMSGFFIPIENMPVVLQDITYLNPMRYFMTIVRDIFQKGSGISFLWKESAPLAMLGVIIFSFSVLKFHKRAV